MDDGIPDFCKLTAEERRQSWKDVPARPMPKFTDPVKAEDPATAAFRAQIEREKQAKTAERIAQLKIKYADRPRKPRRKLKRKARR